MTPRALLRAWRIGRRIVAAPRVARRCPLCGFDGPFEPAGVVPRADALCPGCGSLERHRLLVLADRALGLFRRDFELLHFAPEPCVVRYLDACGVRARRADLFAPAGAAVERLDVTDLALPDASTGGVLISHVLEHVDDRAALREIRRVLRPGGLAVIMVPVVEGWDTTYEDAAITTPEARREHFGQADHVRWYGRDVRDRIRAAGFELREFVAGGADCVRHGLLRGERVFVATRPADAAPSAPTPR